MIRHRRGKPAPDPLKAVQAALNTEHMDWLAVADVLRTSADPAVVGHVAAQVERERWNLAMATEDAWMAAMEFERIHRIWRPAARLEMDLSATIPDDVFGDLLDLPEDFWLVGVLPLLVPTRRAAAVAVAVVDLGLNASTAPWQLGGAGFRLTLLPPGHGLPWALNDILEVGTFVEARFTPFFDIAPGCLYGEPFPEAVLDEIEGLGDEELEELEELHTGSRIGGYRAFNAEHLVEGTRCTRCRKPLWYAAHLAADLFGDTFGEAGSMHVFTCPEGCEAQAMVDAA